MMIKIFVFLLVYLLGAINPCAANIFSDTWRRLNGRPSVDKTEDDLKKKLAKYQQELLRTPNNVSLLIKIAIIQVDLKKYSEAIETYNKALVLEPKSHTIHKSLSELHGELRQAKKALEHIDKAVEYNSDNLKYLKARAIIANWNKNPELALESYKKMLVLQEKHKNKDFDIKETYIQMGELQNQLKNYPAAIVLFNKAIFLEPKNPELYHKLAQTYSAANRPKEALLTINKAVAIEPNNLTFLKAQSVYATWLKDDALAIENNLKRLTLTDDKAKKALILKEIGKLYSRDGKYEKAIETYKQAVDLDPKNAITYYELSKIYGAANKPKDAMNAVSIAIELDPKNMQYLLTKIEIAKWLNDKKIISETSQTILIIDPENKQAKKDLKHSSAVSPQKTTPQKRYKKKLSPYNQLLFDANNYASKGESERAAQTLKKASKLYPNDALIYKRLSELYATINQPKNAINAINKALSIQPRNIKYLRDRGLLASWLKDNVQMEDSHRRILKLKPNDEEAMYKLALSLGWQGRTDEALCAYKAYLRLYPNNADAWLHYAEVLSWTQNYIDAMCALNKYRSLKGITKAYLMKEARVLALVGWFNSSLKVNSPLLSEDEKNYYLLVTEITSLAEGFRILEALEYLKKANSLTSVDQNQLQDLNKLILTPLRHNVNIGVDYISASDTNRVTGVPLTAQYFLTPDTSILFEGLYEHVRADLGTGFQTFDNRSTISDQSAMVGISSQLPKLINFSIIGGGLSIQRGNSHGIYKLLLNPNIHETLRLDVISLRNLYRPYLVPQSPRSVSLEIMESRNGVIFEWQPLLQKYLNVVVTHSNLSDTNAYWHYNIWPKARVYGSEHWLVTLGVNGDFWQYARRLGNGYYDPLDFKGFRGTLELYYVQSENVGYGLWGGFGIQKDETFPRFYYQEDIGGQLIWGIYQDWQIIAKGGYTLRKNPVGQYDAWSAGILVTRRM